MKKGRFQAFIVIAAMTVNLCGVKAEKEFGFVKAEPSGLQVSLEFSDNVAGNALKEIYFSDKEGNISKCNGISASGKNVSVPLPENAMTDDGYIVVGGDFESADGVKIKESEVIEYSVDGSNETYTATSDWCSIGNYNASMFDKPHTVKPNVSENYVKVEKFTALSDFQNRKDTENEIIEFNYKYTGTFASGGSGFFAALFRMQDLGKQDQWSPLATGYGVSIQSDSGVMKILLNKYINTDVQYGAWSANSNLGSKYINKTLASNTDYKFKIETNNTPSGVHITVYMTASGSTSEKILEATDTSSAYNKGYYAFIGDGQTGHLISDISVTKNIKNELKPYSLSDIKKDAEKRISLIPEASKVTSEDFGIIPEMERIIKYLNENGCKSESIEDYDKYLEFKTWQLNVSNCSVETEPMYHILKVEFSAEIDTDTLTKENIIIKKNESETTDFKTECQRNVVNILIFNDRNYNADFDILLKKGIKSVKGFALADEYKYSFDESKCVYPSVKGGAAIEGNTLKVSVTFANKKDNSFALVSLIDSETNAYKDVKYINADGDVIFDKPSGNCCILIQLFDSLTSLKQIYKTVKIFK